MQQLTPYIYVIINKSLNMTPGKVAAQAAHATAQTLANHHSEDIALWGHAFHKGVIVLEAHHEGELRNIKDYLRTRGIRSDFVIDEGTEGTPAFAMTALGTQMILKSTGDDLFRRLRAYSALSPEQQAAESLIRFLTRG